MNGLVACLGFRPRKGVVHVSVFTLREFSSREIVRLSEGCILDLLDDCGSLPNCSPGLSGLPAQQGSLHICTHPWDSRHTAFPGASVHVPWFGRMGSLSHVQWPLGFPLLCVVSSWPLTFLGTCGVTLQTILHLSCVSHSTQRVFKTLA